MSESARIAHGAWRQDRHAAVTAPNGNLALIETRWLSDDELPDRSSALGSGPASISVTNVSRRNIDTGAEEVGLRFWDSESPPIRNFDHISTFEYNPDWVIEARFDPVDVERTIPFEHIRDNGGVRDLVVPGDITFTRDGVEHRLAAFDDGGVLLLVFGDPTNGQHCDSGTYGAGRFLFVQRPDGGAFGEPGAVTLDFNRAFVPPCGFSAEYNCPLPPVQNRLHRPVLAGEKNVVFIPKEI